MSKTLKLEISVADLGQNGVVVSEFATTDYVANELSKKATLNAEGKVEPSLLPDYTYLDGLVDKLDDLSAEMQTAVQEEISSAISTQNQNISTALSGKADLRQGKVPQEQLPYPLNFADTVTQSIDGIRQEFTDSNALLAESIGDSLDEAKGYADTKVNDLSQSLNSSFSELSDDVDAKMIGFNKFEKTNELKPFDSVFANQNNGYPLHSVLVLADGTEVISIVPDNRNNPNENMSGWKAKNDGSVKMYESVSEALKYTRNGEQFWVESADENVVADQYVNNNGVAIPLENTIPSDKKVNFVRDGLESIADMLAIENPKDGMRVYVKSYYEGMNAGGAWYIYSTSDAKWHIKIDSKTVYVEQFGAKFGEKPPATFNVFPDERSDNTQAFNAAFQYCLTYGKRLSSETGKCFFFENIAPLQFYGNVHVDLDGALLFFSPKLRSNPKTDPSLQISGMRKYLGNVHVTTNGYMSSGIEFNKSIRDNQALTVENVKSYSNRYGFYVGEGECINRIRFVNCEATSNYYAGSYISSFNEGGAWTHSAPVFWRDCIFNGNGPQDWILNANTEYAFNGGGTISVRDTATDVGVQFFARGISGGHFLGGQISGHGNPRNSSLVELSNVNMFTFDAFDLEDITCRAKDGTLYTTENYVTYSAERSGSAIVASSCNGLSIRSPNLFGITAPAILKVMNNPGSYEYRCATSLSGTVFTVWDLSNAANGIGACDIHPYAIANGKSVSPTAFANTTNKDAVSSLIHHESGNSDFTVNWSNLKTLWQNGSMAANATDGYLLKTLAEHTDALDTGHLYNEFLFPTQVSSSSPSRYATWAFIELTHAQSSTGRFVFQCLDASNAVLNSNWWNASEGSHYPISGWVRIEIPTGTKKIRYGFVNSGGSNGNIRQHFFNSGIRYNEWHLSVYLIHDGNGSYRNKVKQNFSAAVNEYRNHLIHQSAAVADSAATDIAGLNTKVNELLSALRNSGAVKSS